MFIFVKYENSYEECVNTAHGDGTTYNYELNSPYHYCKI